MAQYKEDERWWKYLRQFSQYIRKSNREEYETKDLKPEFRTALQQSFKREKPTFLENQH